MNRKNFLNILILLLVVLIMAIVVIVMPTRRVTKQKAALGTVNVLLNPPDKTLPIGEETTVAIHLVNEGQKKISFVNIGLSFDQTKLEIVNFTPNSATLPNDFTANDPGLLGRTTGIASLQVGSTAASAGLPSAAGISIGSITIKGKSAGISQMVILTSGDKASQIVGDDPNWTPNIGDQGEGLVLTIGSVQNGTYTVSGGATSTPTPTTTPGGVTATPTPTTTPRATGTPTPTVTPTVTPSPTITPTPLPGPRLSFAVKFQGVDGRPLDSSQYTKRVKVRVTKGDLNETFNADVTSDDQGVFSGSVVLSEVPVGLGYTIFIKGPQHLARKFCVNNQTERCVGAGRIALAEGNNNFDFSKLVLEAGDLPNNGDQDRVVNSVDYSLWKARVGLTVPEALAVADVDFDGIVGGHDWMLMRNTLETKYEEEY